MHTKACTATLLTSADVAREARGEITPATVRLDAISGRLVAAAVTARGQRLFTRDEVERYLAERAARTGRVA